MSQSWFMRRTANPQTSVRIAPSALLSFELGETQNPKLKTVLWRNW